MFGAVARLEREVVAEAFETEVPRRAVAQLRTVTWRRCALQAPRHVGQLRGPMPEQLGARCMSRASCAPIAPSANATVHIRSTSSRRCAPADALPEPAGVVGEARASLLLRVRAAGGAPGAPSPQRPCRCSAISLAILRRQHRIRIRQLEDHAAPPPAAPTLRRCRCRRETTARRDRARPASRARPARAGVAAAPEIPAAADHRQRPAWPDAERAVDARDERGDPVPFGADDRAEDA